MAEKTYSEVIITAFLSSSHAKTIQERAGIGKTKYYRLKNDPEFQKILRERSNAIISDAVKKMEGYLSKDIEILQEIIENPNTSAQVKINGINTLLNQLGNWRNSIKLAELAEKLEDLEDATGQFETF